LPDGCVQTCVTSPPYWGLRDYDTEGQIGLEDTPEELGAELVVAFILGGIVAKGTAIPEGHAAEDGCIPFDMTDVWHDAYEQLPRRN
jgi:hypothetical protein